MVLRFVICVQEFYRFIEVVIISIFRYLSKNLYNIWTWLIQEQSSLIFCLLFLWRPNTSENVLAICHLGATFTPISAFGSNDGMGGTSCEAIFVTIVLFSNLFFIKNLLQSSLYKLDLKSFLFVP